jgi:hypothetical protein
VQIGLAVDGETITYGEARPWVAMMCSQRVPTPEPQAI